MFVHGEAIKMMQLKKKFSVVGKSVFCGFSKKMFDFFKEFPHLPVFMPANGVTVSIQNTLDTPIELMCERSVLEAARRRPIPVAIHGGIGLFRR
jgi:hypothetical protein